MCELPGNSYTAATMAKKPNERSMNEHLHPTFAGMFDHIFGKSASCPIDRLHEFATQQLLAKDQDKQTHQCFAALAAGDTARFGELLARELRA